MSVAVIITSPAICIDEPTDASHWFAQGRTHANMNIPADPHFRTLRRGETEAQRGFRG